MASRTPYDPSWLWALVRYLQIFFSLFCCVYLSIARNSEISYKSGHSINGKDLSGAWGYYVVFAVFGTLDAMNLTSLILVYCTKLVSPIMDLVFNLFIVTAALGGIIATAFAFHGFRVGQIKYDGSSGFATAAFILTFITFALIYIMGGLLLAHLAYRQYARIRKETKASLALKRTLAAIDAEHRARPPRSTTIGAPYAGPAPETAATATDTPSSSSPRPSTSASRRRADFISVVANNSQESDEEGEPKPLLTRQQQIQARIDAVAAPPTYFYATSSHSRNGSSSTRRTDPEAGDDELPTYMA
ncbi:hypothetical protein TWF694_007507 [Orbilia ellipsospora]|uniref:Uncharacterized protein n=1 Tax=Orbilia ellipsospora TaxID=2528407 RepID=A0AAV9XIF9_9PEZI